MKSLRIGIKERPPFFQWMLLSFQHVFAMFGATVLVPMLTGLDIGVALVASGIGTIIYIICTRGKVPVYLGSSFAYIGAIIAAVATTEAPFAAYTGLMLVGVIYAIVALIIRFTGSGWIKKLLPAIVIGPMIIIIGLSLAPTSISSSGLDGSGASYTQRELTSVELKTSDFYSVKKINEGNLDYFYYLDNGEVYQFHILSEASDTSDIEYSKPIKYSTDEEIIMIYGKNPSLLKNSGETIEQKICFLENSLYTPIKGKGSWVIPLVAIITFLTVVGVAILAKGFFKIIPFVIAIVVGWGAAAAFGLVDWALFEGIKIFQVPNFEFIGTYNLDFTALVMFAPLAFVTIAEHIGDHTVLGEICEEDFITDPGLDKTLLGDGIATFVSAAIGGPANTTWIRVFA